MADVKISGLPASTTPLDGTEVLPIVQGTTTKQVSVANLTAGRSTTMSGLILTGVTFANLPAASGVSGQIYKVTDVGPTGSLWQSNGTTWSAVNGQILLLETNIPFIFVSSGSIGNNGALSAITTLPNTYPSAYCYFPVNAIATGVAAGWYYTIFSSTTAGTIYNNVYTTGQPTIPTSPTAFSTTGPGAYTQTTGSQITGVQYVLPANVMGTTGSVIQHVDSMLANTANNKNIRLTANGSALGGTVNATTQTAFAIESIFGNRNATNIQIGAHYTWSNITTNYVYRTIDTTAAVTFAYTLQLATATDYIAQETYRVTLLKNQ